MVTIGTYNDLTVVRLVDFGVYLDDGAAGILLPKRFVPAGVQAGDAIRVFLYHDSEDRLIATTQQPYGQVGDIVRLKAVSTTPQGAFLDWGLMKDLFLPKSQQLAPVRPDSEYLVKIYTDEQTGRIAATERIDAFVQNEELTVEEKEEVDLVVFRRTDIGYVVIINNRHTGVLHHSDIYRSIRPGDAFKGFIRKIYPPDDRSGAYRMDVATGQRGYQRVEGESEKILQLLAAHGGFLPYHDKTDPDTIYDVFGMSKRTFKMTLGKLYREKQIDLSADGIRATTGKNAAD